MFSTVKKIKFSVRKEKKILIEKGTVVVKFAIKKWTLYKRQLTLKNIWIAKIEKKSA